MPEMKLKARFYLFSILHCHLKLLLPGDEWQRDRKNAHRSPAHQIFRFGVTDMLLHESEVNSDQDAQEKHGNEEDIVEACESLQMQSHVF